MHTLQDPEARIFIVATYYFRAQHLMCKVGLCMLLLIPISVYVFAKDTVIIILCQ